MMYLINHFLDTIAVCLVSLSTLFRFFHEINGHQLVFPMPDKAQLNVTNAVSGPGSLGQEVITCEGLHTFAPNFLLVDVRNILFRLLNSSLTVGPW